MQTFKIENDVTLFCIEAESFPHGIQQAWQDLHKRLSITKGRNFYGLSHGLADGSIVYKACVEEAFKGEAAGFGLATFILPKGEYTGDTSHDFMKRIDRMGETFRNLLARDDYDRQNGVCVEQYLNEKDVVS